MNKDEDLKIEMTDHVRDKVASDPKLADFMRDFNAALHQAHDSVRRGQHTTMEDAMEAITGFRPVKLGPDEAALIVGLDDEDFD